MNNFLVLGISLVIITGPIAFAAFLAGYGYAQRERSKALKAAARPIDTPDEYQTVVIQRDRRHVL
jgi:hypothetical protein